MGTTVVAGRSSVKAFKVDKGDIPSVWLGLSTFLKTYPRGWNDYTTIEALYQTALAGSLQFWVLFEESDLKLVAIGHGELHPLRSTYHIVWCGGVDFLRYGKVGLKAIEQWAQLHGFHELSFSGRKGWERWLTPQGFRPKAILMAKNILPYGQGHV